jgi:hypothetical protein
MEQNTTQPIVIMQFLPLMLITIPFVIVVLSISKRKGISSLQSAILALIPFVNFMYSLWLASLPDKNLVERIEKLERVLAEPVGGGNATR